MNLNDICKIEDIPLDVFSIIINNIELKDFRNLLQINKKINSILNQNNIWRILYLKAFINKFKVIYSSLHTDCSFYNPNLYLYETTEKHFKNVYGDLYEATSSSCKFPINTDIIKKNNKILFYSCDNNHWEHHIKLYDGINPWKTSNNKIERINVNKLEIMGSQPLIFNYPDKKKTFKCGCLQYQPELFLHLKDKLDQTLPIEKYREQIRKEWKKYNENHNLCCLCQNPEHYLKNSLKPPETCHYYKSFKNVLKVKLLTKKYLNYFNIKRIFNKWKKLK